MVNFWATRPRVFPTSVGMNRGFADDYFTGGCVPHKRGDEPKTNMSLIILKVCSPQAWG